MAPGNTFHLEFLHSKSFKFVTILKFNSFLKIESTKKLIEKNIKFFKDDCRHLRR